MSYFHVTVNDAGERTWYHVNGRGRCTVCKKPHGVGDCPACQRFADLMETIARLALKRMEATP